MSPGSRERIDRGGSLDGPWEHREARVNGIRMHYVTAGEGPLVILLHGFPEFWYSWRHQIPALKEAGFQVVAPDMRGYNLTDKPGEVRDYRPEKLVGDVRDLVHQLGRSSATVVGHDWGGAVAWQTAMEYPEMVERLVILNAPHPGCFQRELRTWQQLRKSWYLFFFQLPWLPEWWLRRNLPGWLQEVFGNEPSRKDAFTPEEIDCYREALGRPGALTAAVNYYRAAIRRQMIRPPLRIRRISMPTLVLWGEQDPYLGISLLEGLDRWVEDLTVERQPEASHWLQCDAPEWVNAKLTGWLSLTRPAADEP